MPRVTAPYRTILVTGFGAFPGSPRNPTEAIVAHLKRHRTRLARLGIVLESVTLPVVYATLQSRLETLVDTHRPDVILHFGVAGRRRRISVETRAVNRAGLHPDAAGRRADQILQPKGALTLRATVPTTMIAAALRARRVPCEVSRDAGDYVCNATLFRSLAGRLAPEVGFIHVPNARRSTLPLRPGGRPRLSQADLAGAAMTIVLALVRPSPARRHRTQIRPCERSEATQKPRDAPSIDGGAMDWFACGSQ